MWKEPHCQVVGAHQSQEADRAHQAIWEIKDYFILECAGCLSVYFQASTLLVQDINIPLEENNSEPITIYWPSPSKRRRPDWLAQVQFYDADLFRILADTYRALDENLLMFAAMGLRVAFDHTSAHLDADPALSFKEKLEYLQYTGSIGQQEKEHLEILADAGGAVAQGGWKPTLPEIETLMSIGEQFIYRAIVLWFEASQLKKAIPPKPQRRKD